MTSKLIKYTGREQKPDKVLVRPFPLKRYAWALIAVWTGIALASLVWNINELKSDILEAARIQAETAFEKDVLYRRWNAGHGGIYVPVTEKTQPNPYLSNIPERDIKTPSGKLLTLMNPAYMTRQVHEMAMQKNDVRGHITSLHPIRPQNSPDPWETKALHAFERGETEISSVEKIEGNEYMRLMRPLITEKACLKCHTSQGYKEGDIRGGISVSFPMKQLMLIGHRRMLKLSLAHVLLWLLVLGGIGLGLGRLKRSEMERRQAEEEIIRASEEWRNTFDSISDLVSVHDRNFRIVKVNKAFADSFGEKPEELIGRHCHDVVHALDEPFAGCPHKEMLKSSETLTNEFYEPNLGLYLMVTVSPIFEKGELKGSVHIVKDITSRKQAEKVLQEERNKAQQYLDIAGVMFCVLDTDGRVVIMNPKGCEILGYKAGDIIGKNWFDHCLPERLRDTVFGVFSSLIAGNIEPVKYYENHVLRKNGEESIIAFHNAVIRDESGNIVNVLFSGEDITERKKLESQLMHAQRMESIGILAGGVAHDFNNILTAIIGFASVLDRKLYENEPLRQHVEQILLAAEKAADLTSSLLTFSRKNIIHTAPLDINHIIKRLEKFIMRIIGEDIEFRTVLTPDDLNVMADLSQMEQILMNLAANARDSMPKQGKLTIRTEAVRIDNEFIKFHGYGAEGQYSLISISDTGTGMDEQTREKIFEPFFTTKEVNKGTGLGLSIVYGIIKQHNGFINVYSEPGEGTNFRIYLPLNTKAAEYPEGELFETAVPAGGTETILIAEDNAMIRDLITTVLEESGYNVITAEDGEVAVNKFMENKNNIHLSLLDAIMPNKYGIDVYREIQKAKPDSKVIFMSGYPAETMHQKDINEDNINFISKPVKPDDILRKVREVLDAG